MVPVERLAFTYLRGEHYTRPGVVEALLELQGVTDVLPGYESTLVEFDATNLTPAKVTSAADRAGEREAAAAPREVEIPVLYGGEHGPDLRDTALAAGLSDAEAAELHASAEYVVRALGFAPGFPFMAGVPELLRRPRMPAPRGRVPAHSVGVAGHQTGVYTVETPGGWNLIGRSLRAVYDPHRDEPFLLKAGDRVRFSVASAGDGAVPEPPGVLPLLPQEPAGPVFSVLRAGLSDIVVDAGRFLVGRFGLARGGPVDAPAARLANLLVGNQPYAPLLEMTATGPTLAALADIVVAVTGPALVPVVGGEVMDAYRGFRVTKGGELSLKPTGVGARSYLAIAGGLESEAFLGSASTDTRGLIARPLIAGDLLGAATSRGAVPGRSFRPHEFRVVRHAGRSVSRPVATVRVVRGPQFHPDAWQQLLSGQFEVAAASRVGLRLAGRSVPGGEVTSEGVPLGAVQVPPGGDPLVLLHDRGTLGGYVKPAVVVPSDLAVLAQLREGDRLRFRAA